MEENSVITTENSGWTRFIAPLFTVSLITVILVYVFFYDVNGWNETGEGYEYYKHGSRVIGIQTITEDQEEHHFIFDQAGTMKTGWIIYNGHYYYQDKVDGIYTGNRNIDGKLYHFEDDGVFHGGLYIQDDVAYIHDRFGFPKEGLVSSGGSVYCSDANGQVIYGWKNVGGAKRYFDKVTGQMLVDGVYFIDGRGYGFDTNGKLLTGWHTYEDGDRYFSLTSGQMYTGDKVIGKSKYYFEDDGVAYTGYRTVDDKVYFYSSNDKALYTGWLQDGENFYYYDDEGVRAEGLCEIDEKTYFFNEDGKMYTGWKGEYYFTNEGYMATGFVEQNGKIFYFDENGLRWTQSGWVTLNGKRYLFDDNGLVTKTEDVVTIKQTRYKVSSGGTAVKTGGGAVTPETLDSYLLGIMAQYGSDPQSIFNYCRQFSYKYRDKSDINTMACRIINNKNGACWDYAALCYKMLRLAGYNCQIVVGKGAIYSEHNWILIEISPGVWRHMDPERKNYYIYMLTDAQLESYDGIARSVRYQWNHAAYPAAQ